MTKVSVVLYYWILVVATLLFAKTAGLAEDNEAIVKILVVVTILYAGVVMISRSMGKGMEEKRSADGNRRNPSNPREKRKKKLK